VHRGDDQRLNRRIPREERPPARQQTPDADAEERGEQDEIRKICEQADVRRHPPDERDFEEQNEKGREKRPQNPHAAIDHSAG
jgi:hypothetical protein